MTAFCRPEWLVLKPCEQYYRRLYEAHPDYYFYDQGGILFTDWKDFRKQYQQRSKGNEVIPEDPPTALGPELIENTFFANSTKDVSVVFNARYCPPFWHHLCFVKIMYVLHGEIQINISQTKSVILKKGNFLISPPNVKQSVFSYHDDDVVVNVFLRATTFEQSFSSLLSNADVLSEFFWRILYGKDESSILWFQIDPDSKFDSMILAITDAALDASQGSSFFLTSQVMVFWARRSIITGIPSARLRIRLLPLIHSLQSSSMSMSTIIQLRYRNCPRCFIRAKRICPDTSNRKRGSPCHILFNRGD